MLHFAAETAVAVEERGEHAGGRVPVPRRIISRAGPKMLIGANGMATA
jgi:hypothetical protein